MVDFKLTEDQLEMQNLFRKFAQEQILPIAEEMDEKEEMNMDMVKQMMELGFFGVPFSEEVGGTGMDYLTYCLLMEEVGYSRAEREMASSPRGRQQDRLLRSDRAQRRFRRCRCSHHR